MLALLAAALLAQADLPPPTAPPMIEAGDPDPVVPVEAPPPAPVVETRREEVVSDREDVMTKSAWRIHFGLGGGAIDYTTSGAAGFWLEVGKPLYVGDRHAHHQWMLDTTIFVGAAPTARLAQFIVSPTVGTNWYFGDAFGLEWRGGAGFGATPAARFTLLGLGVSLEGSMVFRLFGDDRKRLKITAREVSVLDLLGGAGGNSSPSLCLGAGYEMPLW